ncbi:beta-N-acetylhexosaminidase [Acidipropionibacterium virtanenii]|uniref:beta-N-acetylhexosaminidase n=1 Tax=Acidipropionibacterium virtanenii TaxID=2057246 RepID=A0A344UQ30_9ACTN|nr:beta-N-acetylhexosaminidase [Acidipropionibacterium virtanenii]AXE37378.1 Beta-hexosaminidase [Acidipropionibacterium virtanenii]
MPPHSPVTAASRITGIVPRPRHLEVEDGPGCALTPGSRIIGDEALAGAVRRVLSEATGLALSLAEEPSQAPGIAVALDLGLPEEGYTIQVAAEGVSIAAGSERGAVWAAQVLRQLLGPDAFLPGAQSTRWELPAVRIVDAPSWGWRGCMLDVGRHFMPIRRVMDFVELLSQLRVNTLVLHLTEDQGWRFQSLSHPGLTELGSWRLESINPYHGADGTPHGGFYTQNQLRHLVHFADQYGITVVPELEFPGHAAAALRAEPSLAVPGRVPGQVRTEYGISDDVLNMSEDALQFVADIWTEVLDIFDSKYVAIGGDEAPVTQWVSSPEIARRAAELGTVPEKLQHWFTGWLRDWLVERGRIPVGWDEVIDDGPVDGLVCAAWRPGDAAVRALRGGMEAILAPTSHTYLDYYQSEDPQERYSIGSLTTLDDAISFDPLDVVVGCTGEERSRVLGTQFQLWSEYMDTMEEVEYMAFPRAIALAEAAWGRPDGMDAEAVRARVAAHMDRLEAAGVNVRPLDGPHPWQLGGNGRRRRPPKENQAW